MSADRTTNDEAMQNALRMAKEWIEKTQRDFGLEDDGTLAEIKEVLDEEYE